MSLFTGNVVDGSGTAIECKFQFLHNNTNRISDVRDTVLKQWQVDNEDADVDDGGASFSPGNIAIIHYWTEDACAIVKVVSDGSDSYVFNVQLKTCQAPTITPYIDNGVVGTAITVNTSSSDEYQWEFEDTTHYHKNTWYGRQWCDGVGVTLVEYDYGEGFTTSKNHTFDTAGSYTITVRATNQCGLTAEASKSVEVLWRKPTVQLSNEPNKPKVNEDTVIEVVVTDPDNKITEVRYYMDGVETTELTWSWTEIGDHTFTVEADWFDGFNNQTITEELLIEMEAAALEVELSYTVSESQYTMITDVILGDAPLDYLRYTIKYRVPFTNEAIVCYNAVGNEIELFEFLNTGTYEVTVTGYDELGMTGSDTEIIVVVCPATGTGGTSDRVHYIEWE